MIKNAVPIILYLSQMKQFFNSIEEVVKKKKFETEKDYLRFVEPYTFSRLKEFSDFLNEPVSLGNLVVMEERDGYFEARVKWRIFYDYIIVRFGLDLCEIVKDTTDTLGISENSIVYVDGTLHTENSVELSFKNVRGINILDN